MVVTLRFVILFALAILLSACATNIVAEKASRFDEAVAAYDAGDYPAAYRIWRQLAREDDLAAMRNAAQMLRQGKGVEKDVKHAFTLYMDAAEKGLVTAMANVGRHVPQRRRYGEKSGSGCGLVWRARRRRACRWRKSNLRTCTSVGLACRAIRRGRAF